MCHPLSDDEKMNRPAKLIYLPKTGMIFYATLAEWKCKCPGHKFFAKTHKMQNAVNDRVRELITELNERKRQCLLEIERTDIIESKIRLREELKDLRSGFRRNIEGLKNEPPAR